MSAGSFNQGTNAIAMGLRAGYTNQGENCIAIGIDAGYQNQGSNSIAIGNKTGSTNQPSNSIILNASGTTLNAPYSGLFVKPLSESLFAQPNVFFDWSINRFNLRISSIRFKKNVKNIQQDTSNILKVRPREFDSISNGKHAIGYIVEELKEIDPYFVEKNGDNIFGVDYNTMLVYLVEEFKKFKNELEPILNHYEYHYE